MSDHQLQVLVGMTHADAACQTDPETGRVRLLLSASQTVDSAIAHARRLLPGVHPDVLQRLVRQAMPGALEMQESPAPGWAGRERRGSASSLVVLPAPEHKGLSLRMSLCGVALTLVGGLAGIGGVLMVQWRDHQSPALAHFELIARTMCTTQHTGWEAVCTDPEDQAKMLATLWHANNSQAALAEFYIEGTRKAEIRTFATGLQAQAWARRAPTTTTWQILQVGTTTFAGTDKPRAWRWAKATSIRSGEPIVTFAGDGGRRVVFRPPARS